jgi:hypothetical protein
MYGLQKDIRLQLDRPAEILCSAREGAMLGRPVNAAEWAFLCVFSSFVFSGFIIFFWFFVSFSFFIIFFLQF